MNTYLVPGDEIAHFVAAWNGIPVTIRHPKQNFGSANSPTPDVPIIGRLYNAAWDEAERKLTAEYWIDLESAAKTPEGAAIINAVRNGHVLETSTGYFADEEPTPGNFDGVEYQTVHRNLRPDHIAILPDQIGACSVKDGCGVNRNQAVCANCSQCNTCSISKPKPKEKTMTLKELLAFLQGKGYKVEHNEAEQTFAVEPPPAPAPAPDPTPAPSAELTSVQNAGPQLTQNELEAIRGYINLTTEFGGPEGFKKLLLAMKDLAPMVQNAQASEAAQRANLVESIKANSSIFADEDLAGMTISQLTKLNAQTSVNYAGIAPSISQNADGALELPQSLSAQKQEE